MISLFKKDEFITAFDIDGEFVKVAQIKIVEGKRLLQRLFSEKAASTSNEDILAAVTLIVSKMKLSNSSIILNLPRHLVTVRRLKMPSTDQEELNGMMGLQSSKLLPYPREEIIFDYKVLSMSPDGFSDTMVTLTHRSVIENFIKIFDQSGVSVAKIALSSEVLSNWYLVKQSKEDRNRAIALIEIDSSYADIQIVHNGNLEFTRGITFTDDDRMERLANELRRSFITARKEMKLDISRLVLTGSLSIVKNEAPTLKREFKLPTSFINPLKSWPRVEGAEMPDENQKKNISFTTVLALAFTFDTVSLNLLPMDVQKAKSKRIAKEALFISGLLSACILLSVIGITWKKFDDKISYIRYVNKQIKQTSPKVKELSGMVSSVKLIKRQLDIRGTSVDVIRELYKILPSNISLTVLDYEEGLTCSLRGVSEELSNVFSFITVLENSPYFENVKVKYATKRLVKNRTLTDFEIVAHVTAKKDIK